MDLFLKTETKQQMETALKGAGFLEEDGMFFKEGSSLVILGLLKKVEINEDQTVVTELEGFHANLRTSDPDVISKLTVLNSSPQTPQIVWLD